MVESSPKGWKTLLEKDILLVLSNFSFSFTMFSKDLYCCHVKTLVCLEGVNSLQQNPDFSKP